MIEDDNPTDEPAETAPAETSNPSEAEVEETEAKTETEDTETADKGGGDGGEEKEASADDEEPKKSSRSDRYKRQIERLRLENSELRSRHSGAPPSEREVASRVEQLVGPPPKEEDFNGDVFSYERARTVYEIDRRQTERQVKTEAERSVSERAVRMRELADAHQERVEEFRESAPDFDKVMSAAASLQASPAVEELILESDQSAHLVYYFAKNPARLNAVNRLGEREAAREIGRIESRLSLPKPKTTTQASPPVRPLKGAAAPSSPESSLDAWLAKTYGKDKK